MTRIAILISGRGTNMEAICRHTMKGDIDADIVMVCSDNCSAPGLETASRMGYETIVIPYNSKKRSDAEKELIEILVRNRIDWIVLAGFMKILSPLFVSRFSGRIVNIHPSLLPSFPGSNSIEDAWSYGVRITGVTIHIVDEKVDHGPILAQKSVHVMDDDTLEDLEKKIHEVEHELYWKTLKSLFQNKLRFFNRRQHNGT